MIEDALVTKLRAAGCVYAEDEARLLISAARTPAELDAMVERRVAGVPLEQVLEWAEFCGLRILVDPGVFVPRRRTEFLVREAAALAQPGAVIVDMCCGSGAIGAVMIASIERVQVHAVDIDDAAVECARRNVSGGDVYAGDLYAALPETLRGRVDILVANAPYVPTEEIAFLPSEARDHEPRTALDGGLDGLDVQRRVIGSAAEWMSPGGHLLVETSERQAPQTLDAFARGGLTARLARSEEFDAVVVIGSEAERAVPWDAPP